MKFQTMIVRTSLLLVAGVLAFSGVCTNAQTQGDIASAGQGQAVPVRIAQAIDETRLVQLKGNVHSLARVEFDQGPVSNATPMKRMMLLLQRSPEQETALRQFMDEQMSKESPNFHHWLTPDQFGKLYGPADTDIQTVTGWLASQGFTGISVNRGKTVIEFSGNVGQVRTAFHTEIHKFLVNGEERQANTSDPQIPVALTPVVAGIVSLHNFPLHSMRHVKGQFTRTEDGRVVPQFTGSNNSFFAVGPADFAKIYNIPASLDGTGGKIAIIGLSSIDVQDTRDFRTLFSLPANDPVVVNNGPDPGFGGEEGEADLDVQWSGAVAPKATIHYVLTEGTLTSDPLFMGAEYVIDNNTDDVMSLSFGSCEALTPSGTSAFFNTLWEQAAAQGITVTVSAGDNGTAGCDDFTSQSTATHGISVNTIASTPFNIAVGGTDFDDVGKQTNFWNSNPPTTGNGPGKESAKGYIPEIPWNDSCAATATPTSLTTCVGALATNIMAGSGGPSVLYAKPSFQSGITPNGIAPGDNHRYIPDVSLFASDGLLSNSFYVVCQADAVPDPSTSCAATGPFGFLGVGGTSASAPSFAGIIALIGQSEATAGRSRRQGNANFVLYKIAATAGQSCDSSTVPLTGSTCAFNDVQKGNNSVPCSGASPNCSSTVAATNGVLVTTSGTTKTPAFTTATGYDLATGLGTVNVTNLAAAWGTAVGSFKGTTTALLINNSATPGTITHGTPVTAKVTVAVVAPATGTPTGDVSVLGPSNPPTQMNGGGNRGTLSGGTVTLTAVILPGGTYSATAHYAGDGTFAQSDSTGVPIVVTKENSKLQMGIVTLDPNTGLPVNPNATTVPYGSPYILRMDVLNSKGTACQPLVNGGITTGCAFDATGTVTLNDNGSPLDGGTFILNSEGHTEDQPIQLAGGIHPLTAIYNGDNSYNASTQIADTVTVTKGATVIGLVASPTTVVTGQSVTLTATITTQSSGVGPTGTVTFSTCGTPPCTAALVPMDANPSAGLPASATATLTTTFTTTGTKTITATYGGDTNYAGAGPSTAATVTVTAAMAPTITSISPNQKTAGGTSFVLNINGTNFVAGATVNFGANPALTPSATTPTLITVTVPASDIAAAGTPGVTVTTAGGTSNSVTFTVNPASTGSFTVSGGSGTIIATPGTTPNTVMIPITVTPSGGFAGTVAITCAAPGTSSGSLPLQASCSSLNIVIPPSTTAAVTQSLTVSLVPPSPNNSAMLVPEMPQLFPEHLGSPRAWEYVSAGTGFAAILLLLVPGRKRYRAALGLGLVCMLSFALGCSSASGGGGGGPIATTTSLAVTPGTKNPAQATVTVTPVSGAAAQGTVTLTDATTALSTQMTLNNGVGMQTLGIAGAGTHALTASFAGTATDAASQSAPP
jgi:hypothetical protein